MEENMCYCPEPQDKNVLEKIQHIRNEILSLSEYSQYSDVLKFFNNEMNYPNNYSDAKKDMFRAIITLAGLFEYEENYSMTDLSYVLTNCKQIKNITKLTFDDSEFVLSNGDRYVNMRNPNFHRDVDNDGKVFYTYNEALVAEIFHSLYLDEDEPVFEKQNLPYNTADGLGTLYLYKESEDKWIAVNSCHKIINFYVPGMTYIIPAIRVYGLRKAINNKYSNLYEQNSIGRYPKYIARYEDLSPWFLRDYEIIEISDNIILEYLENSDIKKYLIVEQ